MLRTIHLHGALAEQFGPSFRLAVNTPAEAIRALCTQLHGFERTVAEGEAFRCIIGKRLKDGRSLGTTRRPKPTESIAPAVRTVAAELHQPWRKGEEDFHIVPVVRGRGRGGSVAKIVVGIVLIAASVVTAGAASSVAGMFTGEYMAGAVAGHLMGATAFAGISYGTIAALGAMVVLGGIAQAISPQPKTGDYSQRESPDQRSSYLFNQVVNTVEQGGAVPLIYGETLVGSQVIAMGMAPEDIAYGSDQPDKTTWRTLLAGA